MKYFYLLLCLAVCSCSSFSWKEFFTGDGNSEKRNKKLMEDFDVDKDLAEKFAVKKAPTPATTEKQTTRPQSKAVTDALGGNPMVTNRPIQKTTEKRTAERPKKSDRPIKKKEAKKEEEPKKIVKSIYPEDFPERLIEFDKDSVKFWNDFTPVVNIGEKTILNITYMGINTGKITLTTEPDSIVGSEPVYHFNARVKTSSYYSYLYEVDDYCDTLVRKSDFIPRKFSLIQRESNHNIDDLQLFDLEKLETISLYKKVSKNKTRKKKKVKPIPKYFQDPLSILHFIRGLPLEKTASYRIPVSNQGEVDEFFVKTGKKDTISTEIGKKEAYVLDVETKAKGKTIKGGQMTFWFSADAKKIFLKFEAEIKIGSVEGEIEEYMP